MATAQAGKNFLGPWSVGGSSPLTGNVEIIDSDDKVTGATIRILDAADSVFESLTATDAGNITSSYAGGVLTITGEGTAAQYKTVLQSIRYTNSKNPPSYTTRHFQVDVNGGTGIATAYSTISQGNPATSSATIDLNGTDEFEPGVNFSRNWNVGSETTIADSDAVVDKNNNTNINKVVVRFYDDPADGVTNVRPDGEAEVLKAADLIGGNVKSTFANGVLTLQGPGSEAEFSAAIRSIVYTNAAQSPTGKKRQFIFDLFANDGNNPTAFAISTITIGSNPDSPDDLDGDGIPDDVDTDDDGDGISDSEDPDSDGDGETDTSGDDGPPGEGGGGDVSTGGDSGGSFGTSYSRLDLNGPDAAGFNYLAKWNIEDQISLTDDDATIKDTSGRIKKLVVSIVGGPRLAKGKNEGNNGGNNNDNGELEYEQLLWTPAGGIEGEYDEETGILTLLAEDDAGATRQAFETVLRSVRYFNPPQEVQVDEEGDGGNNNGGNNDNENQTKTEIIKPVGTERKFRFDLYGNVNDANKVTSVAFTTINTKFTGNEQNDMFFGQAIVVNNVATITFKVTNKTDAIMYGIHVDGTLAGGKPYTQAAEVSVTTGEVRAKFVNPSAQAREIDPTKGSKLIRWRIEQLAPGQEATLTIKAPLRPEIEWGSKLTQKWTADFPGFTPDESVDPMEAR